MTIFLQKFNLKNIFFFNFLFLYFIFSITSIYGHFEPPKTLKEKEKKEFERNLILKYKIRSLIVWKYRITNDIVDTNNKEIFYKIIYDENGNVSVVFLYDESGLVKYKDVFIYDEYMNVITYIKYLDDKMVEKSLYKYDTLGRVIEQINYIKEDEIDSKFTYEIQNDKNQAVFNKYKPLDSIEYKIIYIYDGLPDYSNNIKIMKQKPDGTLIMKVENIFNDNYERTQKKIYDDNNQLLYYFSYKYFDNINIISEINKISPEEKILSKIIYTLNSDYQINSVSTFSKNNTIESYLEYLYEYGN